MCETEIRKLHHLNNLTKWRQNSTYIQCIVHKSNFTYNVTKYVMKHFYAVFKGIVDLVTV